jgi:YidC/Oxa1 family membrane protein insertase
LAEFKNPQQEPGMERRLLLVFALTFLVILLFQPLLKKYGPQTPAPRQESSQAAQNQAPVLSPSSTPTSSQVSFGGGGLRPSGQPGVAAPTQPYVPQVAASEKETVIENDVYRIVFTNRGGRVKSWLLKKYTDDKGAVLELVNATAADRYGYPLTLWLYDEALRNKVNSALYVGSLPGQPTIDLPGRFPLPDRLTAPAQVDFEYDDGDVSVRKTYTFDGSSYVVGVKTAVYQKGAQVTAFPMWPAGFGDETSAPSYAATQVVYQYDSKVERLGIKKISGGGTLQGPFHWAGLSDQYFAAVFLPQDPQNAAMVTLYNTIEIPRGGDSKQMDKVPVLGAAVGSLNGVTAGRLYVGPKALPDLESVPVPGITGTEPDLRALVDFGWLGYIARPLFLWLKWTYNHIVPNWGWAIVLQTIIINLALLPLRLSQMKSMLKMQRVAPQIKVIQEKYKKYSLRDPKKAEMNQEISELYKQHGVNPVGGCLPLIIQMPFLFAYYRMLGVAIDLRHASWLWVHDLSSPEHMQIHVLPIIVIISMLFMQRMTPQAGMDPAQQKMMNIMMPGMLGVISWNLAAGLCLYWSVGNLIGIVQQVIMNRTALGREMREMMEKRARKKDK